MTDIRTVMKKEKPTHSWRSKLTILLLALVAVNSPQSSAETFLPMQEITLGGKVVVPSCTVRLDTGHLRFDRTGSVETASQRQNLILSECDIEQVGVMFQAETWPGYPARGVLKSKDAKQPSATWHYRVAPAAQEDSGAGAIWPLTATTDARDLETEAPSPGSNPLGQYFSLRRLTYWYDVKRPPQGEESLVIPFLISVHRTLNSNDQAEDLEAVFSLQLTYR